MPNINFKLECLSVQFKFKFSDLEDASVNMLVADFSKTMLELDSNQDFSLITATVHQICMRFLNENSKKIMFKVSPTAKSPAIEFCIRSFKTYSVPTEIVFKSEKIESNFETKCLTHMILFFDFQELSSKLKAELKNNFADLKAAAKNEISELFYEQRKYKVCIEVPYFSVFLLGKNQGFYLELKNFSLIDVQSSVQDNEKFCSCLGTSFLVKLNWGNFEIIPEVPIFLHVNTLKSQYLMNKWKNTESPYDQLYDIEVNAGIDQLEINFGLSLIEEINFVIESLKISHKPERKTAKKKSILKNCSKIAKIEGKFEGITKICMAVLKDESIFFLESKESAENFDYLYLPNSNASLRQNKIDLQSNLRYLSLTFTKESDAKDWFNLIFPLLNKKLIEPEKKSLEKSVLRFDFQISSSKIRCFSKKLQLKYLVELNNQVFSFDANKYSINFLCKLESGNFKDIKGLVLFESEKACKFALDYYQKDSKKFRGNDIVADFSLSNAHCYLSISSCEKIFETFKKKYSKLSSGAKFSQKKINKKCAIYTFSLEKSKLHLQLGNKLKDAVFSIGLLSGKIDQSSKDLEIMMKLCDLLITLEYLHDHYRASSQVEFEYKKSSNNLSIHLLNTYILKQRHLLSPVRVSISYNKKNLVLDLTKLYFSIEKSDFDFLNDFVSLLIPKKKPSTKIKDKILTDLCIIYESVGLCWINYSGDPIFEVFIENLKTEIMLPMIFLHLCVSIQFFNPLIQQNDLLLERTFLAVEAVIDKQSSLRIQCQDSSSVNLNITDYMINNLYAVFYEKRSETTFSVWNNTGYDLNVISGSKSQSINDGQVERVDFSNEKSFLSCELQYKNNTKLTLSHIPLFSEEIELHCINEINNIQIKTSIKSKGLSKQLKISSAFEIKNHCGIELDVCFLNGKDVENFKTLKPKSVSAVPLEYFNLSMCVLSHGADINNCNSILLMEMKEEPVCMQSFCCYFLTYLRNNTIHITPTLVIYNYLPENIFIWLGSNDRPECVNESQSFYFSASKELSMKVSLACEMISETLILFPKSKKYVFPSEINLKKGLLVLRLGCKLENSTLTIYPLMMIANNSQIPLSFHVPLKDSMPSLSEEVYIRRLACSPVDSLIVKLDDELSEPVDLTKSLRGFCEISKGRTSKIILVYQVKTVQVPREDHFTKIVEFYSRYIFVNLSDYAVEVMQVGTDPTFATIVAPLQSTYFYWENYAMELNICVKMATLTDSWGKAFPINKMSTVYEKCDCENVFLRVSIQEDYDLISVTFSESRVTDFIIKNMTAFEICCYQGSEILFLEPNSKKFFALDNLFNSINVQFSDKSGEFFQICELDCLNKMWEIKCSQGKNVYFMIQKESDLTALIVSESPINYEIVQDYLFSFFVCAPSISVSLIQQDLYHKSEVLLLTLDEVRMTIEWFKHHIYYNLSVEDIQIDSQTHSYVVSPVFLVSSGPSPITCEGILIRSKELLILDKITIGLKDLNVSIDSNSLENILKFFGKFRKQREIFQFWGQEEKHQEIKNPFYIAELKISCFAVNLTYKVQPSGFSDSLKSIFVNFDRLKVPLEKVSYQKFYCNINSFKLLLFNTYKKMVMSNISGILAEHGALGGTLAFFLRLAGKISKKKVNKDIKIMHKEEGNSEKKRIFKSFLEKKSEFSEILKHSLKLPSHRQKKVNFKSRQRFPKVFYGRLGLIKPFNDEDCFTVDSLISKKSQYENYNFYGFLVGTQANQNVMAIIFYQQIALLNADTEQIIDEMETVALDEFSLIDNNIVICGKNLKKKYKRHHIQICESKYSEKFSEIIYQLNIDMGL